MSPAFGGWEKEEQAGHRTLPVPGCGKVEKPQKVGSEPERRERACKRTAQAQRDFLRGGAVLLPGGERSAPTEPAGETNPNGEAAFCAEKCGEPQGFAVTWKGWTL